MEGPAEIIAKKVLEGEGTKCFLGVEKFDPTESTSVGFMYSILVSIINSFLFTFKLFLEILDYIKEGDPKKIIDRIPKDPKKFLEDEILKDFKKTVPIPLVLPPLEIMGSKITIEKIDNNQKIDSTNIDFFLSMGENFQKIIQAMLTLPLKLVFGIFEKIINNPLNPENLKLPDEPMIQEILKEVMVSAGLVHPTDPTKPLPLAERIAHCFPKVVVSATKEVPKAVTDPQSLQSAVPAPPSPLTGPKYSLPITPEANNLYLSCTYGYRAYGSKVEEANEQTGEIFFNELGLGNHVGIDIGGSSFADQKVYAAENSIVIGIVEPQWFLSHQNYQDNSQAASPYIILKGLETGYLYLYTHCTHREFGYSLTRDNLTKFFNRYSVDEKEELLNSMKLIITEGQKVSAGQHIGYYGDLGRSAGAHLHFEVHRKPLPKGTNYRFSEWQRRNDYAIPEPIQKGIYSFIGSSYFDPVDFFRKKLKGSRLTIDRPILTKILCYTKTKSGRFINQGRRFRSRRVKEILTLSTKAEIPFQVNGGSEKIFIE